MVVNMVECIQLEKFNCYSNDIIFIDGLWGTGKSILGPIISGMHGVEKQKLNHIYEYLCVLRHLKKIDSDAAVAMMQTHSDLDQYNNLIGREINLRWGDDSGPSNNPNSFRYLGRMFSADGDSVVDYINDNNIALNIMSHMILPVVDPLIDAFGDRLKIVQVVRHPLYMVKHWLAYFSRFDGPREFTISLDFLGNKVPWFAHDWREEFVALSLLDRVLVSIKKVYSLLFHKIDEMREWPSVLLTVNFEQIVFKPHSVLEQLEQFLGRGHHSRIKKILRKQKLPRDGITHGRGHAAYGWQAGAEINEKKEYEKLMELILKSGSEGYTGSFVSLIEEYNKRWPSILSQFV